MRTPASLLHSTASYSSASPSASAVDSNMVVIQASLLCALICVAGLALVARCACRRLPAAIVINRRTPQAQGMKKKAIEALPTAAFAQHGGVTTMELECGICLAEFAAGEELRVLPRCAHAFHVACIDTWLGAHATCPSCRTTVAASSLPGRCRRCGGPDGDDQDQPPHPAAAAGGGGARDETFLPAVANSTACMPTTDIH